MTYIEGNELEGLAYIESADIYNYAHSLMSKADDELKALVEFYESEYTNIAKSIIERTTPLTFKQRRVLALYIAHDVDGLTIVT
jgi:hypothetical protein